MGSEPLGVNHPELGHLLCSNVRK